MARLFLTSGQSFGTIGAGLATNVFGTTAGLETVSVAADGDAIFDPSFNAGGDTINIGGNAALYTASLSGSNLVLTSGAGASITIPVGTVGATINFADAAGRTLLFNGTSVVLGSQSVSAGGVAVTAGSGGTTPPPPPSGSSELILTSSTDIMTGTSGNDQFWAWLAQNPTLGGVSNTLSSADRLFGGLGSGDSLYAELIPEFFSGTGSSQIDTQPTIRSIEDIDFEARDLAVSGNIIRQIIWEGAPLGSVESKDDGPRDVAYAEGVFTNQIIIVDGKNMRDVDHIGSANSDGDLVIENLNTLTTAGAYRNTEALTITMDHTDNFNSDNDASDLHVYFDDDYLLAGQSTTTSQANYWLLDEDSTDYVNAPLRDVERNGVTFSIGGNAQTVRVSLNTAGVPDTWEGYAAALQADINNQIAAGNLTLQGITVVVDYNNTDQTFNDLGQQVTIPAITLLDASGRTFSALGFITPADSTGAFDIYGRFDTDPSEQFDNPITINIDLHKVGRNGDGGDLIIGGKNGDKGIEGEGPASKPSNLGTIASTGGDLAEVYIKTAAEFAGGTSFASLEVRDGFGDAYNGWDNPSVPETFSTPGDTNDLTPNDLRLVDADAFKGNLYLGTVNRVVNLDTLVARGGGDVHFYGDIDGDEVAQPYSYSTGAGDDIVDLLLDGDGLDYAQSGVTVSTNSGNDLVVITTNLTNESETINQAILRNITISTGADNDTVIVDVGSTGNSFINTGTGNDVVYTDNGESGYCNETEYAAWAFNFDDANDSASYSDMTGVQLSPMYLAGATVTVSFSGAGIYDDNYDSFTSALNNGGGVMAVNGGGDADAVPGPYINGYESSVTIGSLISGRSYFGDQRDINAAVLKAINEHPVLSKLLFAEIKENNTLVVYSLTSGDYEDLDLEINVNQANWSSAAQGNGVLNEARTLTANSALSHSDVWGVASGAATTSTTYQGAGPLGNPTGLLGPAEGDATYNADLHTYYTGLGVDNTFDSLIDEGDQSENETDNTVNLGTGNDLWVLSTDSVAGDIPTMTVSSGNALLNGASNETLVLEALFGNDTIMNFETGYFEPTFEERTATVTVTVQGTATTTVSISTVQVENEFSDSYQDGLDFLNFGSYLTSREDNSVNTAGEPDSDVSHRLIAVTLDYNQSETYPANPDVEQRANEVTVVRFVGSGSATFAGVTETVVEGLFNNHGTTTFDYGNLLDENINAFDEYTATGSPTFTDQLTNTAKGIFMVENGANRGEYKVFELSWNGNDTADTNGTSDAANANGSSQGGVVDATLVGTLDFGASLDGLHEINLVGSVEYAELLREGWNGMTMG